MYKKGQTLVEYLILIAVVAIASLGIVRLLGNTLQVKLAQITAKLQGKSVRSIKVNKLKKQYWKNRNLGNFHESDK